MYFCRRIYNNNSLLLRAFMGQMYCNNNYIMYGRNGPENKKTGSRTRLSYQTRKYRYVYTYV